MNTWLIKTAAVVLAFLWLVDSSAAQVHYRGWYNGRYYDAVYDWNRLCCNNENCRMRQDIVAELQRQDQLQQQGNQQQDQFKPVRAAVVPVSQVAHPPELRTQTIEVREPYTVTERVCVGRDRWGRCIFADRLVTHYRTVRKTVPVASLPTSTSTASSSTAKPPANSGVSSPGISPGINTLTNTALVATPQEVVDAMLQWLSPTSSQVVFDLGSGDGRVLFSAARDYGSIAVGVELDADRVELTRRRADLLGLSHRVLVFQGDVLEYDLAEADCVTMYLYPDLMERAVKNLKPGTRVASYSHPIPGVECTETTVDVDGVKHCIFSGVIE